MVIKRMELAKQERSGRSHPSALKQLGRWWNLGCWGILGGMGLLASCSTPPPEEPPAPSPQAAAPAPGSSPAPGSTAAMLQSLPQFDVQGLPPVPPPPSTTLGPPQSAPLLSPTAAQERLAQVPRGRANPFAGFEIAMEDITVAAPPEDATPNPAPAAASGATPGSPSTASGSGNGRPGGSAVAGSAAIASAPMGSVPVASVPGGSVAGASAPVGSAPLAGGAIVAPPPAVSAPPASPTALAENLEIKGIMQMGTELKLIIKEGEGTATRTVQVGDRVAGGQVLIRKIEVPTNGSPRVVLEQGGVTVVRSVS